MVTRNTRNWGFLPIPRRLQHDPNNPFALTTSLNVMFGFASTMTVANLYYVQPLLVQFAKTFSVTDTEVAQIPTLTQAGYAVGLVFLTPLGDLVPRRPLILLLLISSSALSLGLALAPSLKAVSAISFLLGVVTVTPQVLIPLAADLAHPDRRASAVSIVLSGLLLGVLVARVLAGIIAEFTGLEGWRNVYWMALGVQAATWFMMYFMLPDWPAKNKGTGLTYFGLLKSMVVYAVTEPLLIQCYLLGCFSSAVFSNFWVTLTFLLDGPPYHYTTLQIGLFGLVGILGVCTAPFVGRLIDKYVPWLLALAAILSMMVFQAIQVGAGGISVAAVIIVIFGLDVGRQMQQISCATMIYSISSEARARLNSVFIIWLFIGQVVGTVAGTRVFEGSGWRAGAGLSLGWIGAMLLVLLLRGPRCPKNVWLGWQGGWALRAERKETSRAAELEQKGTSPTNSVQDPEKANKAVEEHEASTAADQEQRGTSATTSIHSPEKTNDAAHTQQVRRAENAPNEPKY
ncbi:MFS general substrate transporter [Exidia glandulosa HHB12029]|uniref:MFS general substrate transporter n=1 Tax=Exidia glandulosa HHB12029 TaxID=1314781 RepID=A0A165JGV9_EXIGL|nr:MFS general substrate transporter [Exidia glandulosa HHB12029]